ncbi:MAG: hypothetical protein HS111_22770 [Kofleriaceae bacterium]|nr:hypothetical protein [Kofleriaceae bacterium]
MVTSAVVSPRLGSIALGYLHRTVWAAGGEVEVEGAAGDGGGQLPLPPAW